MLLNQLAEGRLAGVDNVQKAVLVLLVIVQLLDRHGDRRHGLLVDEQIESLVRMELQATSDDLHNFSDGDVVWHEIFTVVQ